jgi:YihY family inner membrane protein
MGGDELSADDAWTTLRRHGGWRLTADSVRRFREADGFSHSRALALQLCLAVLPLGVALVGLSRALGGAGLGEVLVRTLRDLSPGASRSVVNEAVRAGEQRASAGHLALWLGLLAGIVSLTIAMGLIERGANRIYGVETDRSGRAKYTRACVLGVTAGFAGLVGFLVLLAGSSMAAAFAHVYFHGSPGFRTAGEIGRWPVGILLALLSFTVLFARSPNRRQPGQSWLAVGAGVALLLWLVFTAALALYVSHSSTFGSTYGPLTGVIALLIWANLTSVAIFLGLSFAAQLEAIRAGVARRAETTPEAVTHTNSNGSETNAAAAGPPSRSR